MKYLILFYFYALSINAFSQMIINAGDDTTICVTWNTPGSLILGGTPTVSGGTGPYTFTWECNYNYVVGPNTYLLTASDFLDDTTIANPDLIHTVNSPVTFILTVTDDIGQISIDTVIISFSIFNTHLIEYSHSMLNGDSVKFISLPNVGGGIAPLTYLWRPNHGLTDSLSYTNFWVKPSVSTSYYLTVTDTIGCVVTGSPMFHVHIGYLNLSEIEEERTLVYPNPTSGQLFLKNDNKRVNHIVIYDQFGKICKKCEEENCKEIDISELENGIYEIVMSDGSQIIKKQIIKGEK